MLETRRIASWSGMAAAVLVAACTDSAETGDPKTSQWLIGSEPIVSIGAEGSPTASPLDNVSGAVLLSNGVVVVADGGIGSARLAAFAANGTPLGLLGGTGDGPGEFRWITHLERGPRDSIYAFDQSHQRLTTFSAAGLRVRTAQFHPGYGETGGDRLRLVSRLSDTVWVGRTIDSPVWGEPSRILRDTVTLGMLNHMLRGFQPIARVPGAMSTSFERRGRQVLTTPLFTPVSLVATWGRCLFASSGEDATISIFASDGRLASTLTGPGSPREVIQEHADSVLAFRLRQTSPEEAPLIRSTVDEVPRTRHLPFYAEMVLDEWGHIWLKEYNPPGNWPARWYVVSQAGALLGEVEVPGFIRIFSIAEDGILGTTSGQFAEDVVELRPLLARPDPATPLDACTPTS